MLLNFNVEIILNEQSVQSYYTRLHIYSSTEKAFKLAFIWQKPRIRECSDIIKYTYNKPILMIYSSQTHAAIHIVTILQTRISVILCGGKSVGDNRASTTI